MPHSHLMRCTSYLCSQRRSSRWESVTQKWLIFYFSLANYGESTAYISNCIIFQRKHAVNVASYNFSEKTRSTFRIMPFFLESSVYISNPVIFQPRFLNIWSALLISLLSFLFSSTNVSLSFYEVYLFRWWRRSSRCESVTQSDQFSPYFLTEKAARCMCLVDLWVIFVPHRA